MRWKSIVGIVLGVVAAVLAVWVTAALLEREAPRISFVREPGFIGRNTTWSFRAEDAKSGLGSLLAVVEQDGATHQVLAEQIAGRGIWGTPPLHSRLVDLRLDYEDLGLREGPATLAVTVRDRSFWKGGNVSRTDLAVMVDTTPPRIELTSTGHYLRVGGSGLVTYRLGEPASRTGVEVNGIFFPAYRRPEAESSFLAYFTVPHDAEPGSTVRIVATDQAGNASASTVPALIRSRPRSGDTIRLSDAFLSRKMPEFRERNPGLDGDPLKAFIEVNRGWRDENHARIRELTARSREGRLWEGAFLQMRNTKKMAGFADKRSYTYEGTKIDEQYHLGVDLASTAGAPVPAGNHGLVAWAGDLGIYGQTVLLDHGQGIFSLYAHLASLAVTKGEAVKKGQVLGSSGQTGMAGGDHLHFSMLVSGEFVDPVEWLDAHWISDNVDRKIAGAAPGP